MAAVVAPLPARLPAIPEHSAVNEASALVLEADLAREVVRVEDVEALLAWRNGVMALINHFRSKPLQSPLLPLLGAQRRVEARIGQLLGIGHVGRPPNSSGQNGLMNLLKGYDRQRYRILAKGLERGLTDEEWRKPREPLLRLIQAKYPTPQQFSAYVQADGSVKKPHAVRVEEIKAMVAKGALAAQIGEQLGIGESRVRYIAHKGGIRLHDTALGPQRAVDPHRVVEKIVYGLEGTQMSIARIGDNLTGISSMEATQWVESLSESITCLKRLRSALWRMTK